MRARRICLLTALTFAAVCCTPAGGPAPVAPPPPAGWSGPGSVPPPRRMRLFFGGDVMQHMPQVDAVRDAGVDVAVLANNHCCDNGAEGIRTSVEELDRCGIRHTGAFADSADYNKNNPLYLTYCGIRLAIVNYTYGTNGMPVPEGTVVNLIDTVRMAADLAAARASGVDFIVACVHWGDEYQRRENAAQRSLAAFLRRHGTDVVVGSHPHVIQPWVADSSHVVLYSLGNLVSGQRRRYTDGGLVATVEAVRHPEGRMTYRLETTPVWVSVPGYRILTPEAADTMTLPAAYGIFRADLDALPGNGL